MNINFRLCDIPTPDKSLDPQSISGSREHVIKFDNALFVPRKWIRVSGCYTKVHKYNKWMYDEHLIFDFIPRIANTLVDDYYIHASFVGCGSNLPVRSQAALDKYGEWWNDYAYVACHAERMDKLLSLMGLHHSAIFFTSMGDVENAAVQVGIDDRIVITNEIWGDSGRGVELRLRNDEDETLLRLALR